MADRSGTPWDRFPAPAQPGDQVSRSFQFYELTRSDLAQRLRIGNAFASTRELRAAVNLCREVLQPLRDEFGRFSPNSVYRGQALERALKKKPASWNSTSQHCAGEAADVEIAGMATLELARWVERNLKFDQLICECYDPRQGPNSGWVHVSLKAPGTGENRGELLSYVFDARKRAYAYVEGLLPSAA